MYVVYMEIINWLWGTVVKNNNNKLLNVLINVMYFVYSTYIVADGRTTVTT